LYAGITMERSSVGEFICDGAARIARHAERPPRAGLYRLKKDSSMKCQQCLSDEAAANLNMRGFKRRGSFEYNGVHARNELLLRV
jgi:hypothetical protein